MTKNVSTTKKQNFKCKECYWSIPDMNNLSIPTQEPIMGSCRFQKYKVLLNQDACDENFKKRDER